MKQFGLLLLRKDSRNKKYFSPFSFFSVLFLIFLCSCQTPNLSDKQSSFSQDYFSPDRTIISLDDDSISELAETAEFLSLASSVDENDFGVFSFKIYSKEQKINANCSVVRINLKNPQLKIQLKTSSQTAENFSQILPVVSINTVPFSVKNNKSLPVGIVKIDGEICSEPVEKYCAFLFTNSSELEESTNLSPYCVKIEKNQLKTGDFDTFDNIIGGFFQILENGEVQQFKQYRDSRIALGISESYIYLLTAFSNSIFDDSALTYEECAKILKAFSCENAMQFDGGSSSCLCINGVEKTSVLKKRINDIPIFLEFSQKE